ncbi:MAG: AAA family ATPase [Ornithinibacter sp.]
MHRWESPALPTWWSAASPSAFVGRRRELALLDESWTAVERGLRQVVFLGGEPGAGKSRLLAEVCAVLHEQGAAVLVGSCVEEMGPVHQPFEPVAAGLLAGLTDGSLGDDPSEGGRHRGEAAARLRTLAGLDGPDRSPRGLDERRELFDALVRTVRAAAADRPLALALEDLHLAGPTAVQLLGYLVQQTGESRVFILATHRTTAPDRSEVLLQQMAHLYGVDGVRRVDLTPLDTEDITEYLVREGQVPRHRAAPAAVVLRDRTGGNPFFLREVWRDIDRRGGFEATTLDALPAPEVVRETVRGRLSGLPEPMRELVSLVAVVGEDVDVDLLQKAVGAEDALRALDELVAMGLVEPVPELGTHFRFVHALARQSVLDLMPPSQRARHHQRVAVALEEGGGTGPRHVERLAYHYGEAAMLGHAHKAVLYLVSAAEIAERGLAHQEAGRRFERAAALSEEPDEHGDLLLRASRSHLLASDFRRALDLAGRVARVGSPRMRLRGAISMEDARWYTAAPAGEVVELLTDALAGIPAAADDPDRVRAMGALGRARAHIGDPGEGDRLATEALRLARGLGDDELVADVLSCSLQVGLGPTVASRRLPRALELSELAIRIGQWRHLGPAAFHRAFIAYETGDPGELARANRDLQRTARASGQQYWTCMAESVEFAKAVMSADFGAAQESCRQMLELTASLGDDTEGAYGVQSFMIRRETGGLEAVRGLIDGTEDVEGTWPPALLALYTELGLSEAARRVLDRVLAPDLTREQGSARWPGTLAFVAEAVVALDDHGRRAARARELLEDHVGRNLLMGPFVGVFGAADRYIGSLDSLLGRGDPDASFAAALELDTRMCSTLHEAHTLAAWSHHVRRTRPRDPDGELFADRARAIADAHDLVRVHRVLQPVAGLSASGALPLTPREVQVLRLVAQGCSNRQVARRLGISENTAANHVRGILVKTGCGNRTQAAMFGADHGLLA